MAAFLFSLLPMACFPASTNNRYLAASTRRSEGAADAKAAFSLRTFLRQGRKNEAPSKRKQRCVFEGDSFTLTDRAASIRNRALHTHLTLQSAHPSRCAHPVQQRTPG